MKSWPFLKKKAKFVIILIFVLKPVINCRYIWLCWWKWWRKLWIFSWWIIFAQFLQFWRFLDIQTRIAMWHRYSISMQGPKKMYSLRLGLWWWSEYTYHTIWLTHISFTRILINAILFLLPKNFLLHYFFPIS